MLNQFQTLHAVWKCEWDKAADAGEIPMFVPLSEDLMALTYEVRRMSLQIPGQAAGSGVPGVPKPSF